MNPTTRAHVGMTLQTAVIGPGFSLANLAAQRVDPLALMVVRAVGVAVLFGLYFVAMGGLRQFRVQAGDWPRLIGMAVVGIMGNQLLYIWGIKYTTPGNASLLYAATPLAVMLLAVYAQGVERLTLPKFLALLVALAGVVLILLARDTHLALDKGLGNALIIAAVCCYAYYIAYSRPLSQRYPPILLTAFLMVLGPLLFLPVGVMIMPSVDWGAIAWGTWGAILYIIVINVMLAYALIAYALQTLPSSQVAIYVNLQPVSATLFSVLWLGEQLSLQFLLGGLLTLGGVFWLNRVQIRMAARS